MPAHSQNGWLNCYMIMAQVTRPHIEPPSKLLEPRYDIEVIKQSLSTMMVRLYQTFNGTTCRPYIPIPIYTILPYCVNIGWAVVKEYILQIPPPPPPPSMFIEKTMHIPQLVIGRYCDAAHNIICLIWVHLYNSY